MANWRLHLFSLLVAVISIYIFVTSNGDAIGELKLKNREIKQTGSPSYLIFNWINFNFSRKKDDDDTKTGKSGKYASYSYLDYRYPSKNRTQIGSENATMLMLVRNDELVDALDSIRSIEEKFNRHYRYPWVFMNDVPFTEEFIERTTMMASGVTFYELIPEADWQPPSFIDQEKYSRCRKEAEEKDIIYGGSKSYRNMCRFNSGFFYKQKRLLNYDWYFRVEPDAQYLCDFLYDPFELLRRNNKIYGFTIAIVDYENTIPSLWYTAENFIKDRSDLIHPNNSIKFLTTIESKVIYDYFKSDHNSSYNLCHFWSNFEIANLNFFRSEAYQAFFDYLDKSGGFYYERWGDAPVHSIGLALLADKNSIHHFDDVGYFHPPFLTCPTAQDAIAAKKCVCKVQLEDETLTKNYDFEVYSCLPLWWRYGAGKFFLSDTEYSY